MLTICDTHILLFWADSPSWLSPKANTAVNLGIETGSLACSDISLWEIAMLYSRGRINNHAGISASSYLNDILTAMCMSVLPITTKIAEVSQSPIFIHGDPADRIIAATTLVHRAQLITADDILRNTLGVQCIW